MDMFILYKALLDGKHNPQVTESMKRKKWEEIVVVINACGVALRTKEKTTKKIRDLKNGARDYQKGFKSPKKKLWYYDTVLDHIIGRDSPYLHGVVKTEEAFHFNLCKRVDCDYKAENFRMGMLFCII